MSERLEFMIPSQAHSTTLFSEVGRVFGNFGSVPNSVVLDFSRLRFCRPAAVVFLSNLTNYLVRLGVPVSWRGIDQRKQAIRFLDDSLFFKQHIGHLLSESAQPRATTRPLLELRHTHSHSWISFELVPWLVACSGLPEEAFAEFRTCMSELFNNINDHSNFDVGSTFAQWYPNESRLIVAVADFGRGIPSAVRTVEPDHADGSAIIRAFDEGFSSRTTPRNRGAGLYLLQQNVLDNLGGALRVSSGSGSVRFWKSSNSLRSEIYSVAGYCPGTMIEFEIRTDQIELGDIGEVDFQW